MKHDKYIALQNPETRLWHLCGYAGMNRNCRPTYIPVRAQGHATKTLALADRDHQLKADAAARNLVKGV